MSNVLKDSNLPPGALVETYENGGALRNDGIELTPAAKNPWYVLATVAGNFSPKNRRYWNGWMCQDLSAEERKDIAEKLTLTEAELAPLSNEEWQQIQSHFKAAFPDQSPSDMIPNTNHAIEMHHLFFRHPFSLRCFYFATTIDFIESHFAEKIDFYAAYFNGIASFEKVHFAANTFFPKTSFTKDAYFHKAYFAGIAGFDKAHFCDVADFEKTYFDEKVYFSDSAFKGQTSFEEATFKTEVPKFFQRAMHQNTTFTDNIKYWPEVTADNAEEGKQAYTRLRQIAADNHNPDLEHFFLRQEMRCKEAIAKGFDKWVFKGYRWLSDSGISVMRPALGLLLAWLYPAIIYLCSYFYLNHYTEKVTEHYGSLPALANLSIFGPFGLSFANLFAFLGFNRLFFKEVIAEFGPWLSFLAGIQTITGVVLLFLLGLGLRNRFRLK